MSDAWTDDDLDDILGNSAGDNSTIKLLREKIKADNAAMKQMRTELDTMRNQNRGTIVKDALKSAGLSEGAAGMYQGEADPTAVQAWVEANRGWIAPAGAQPVQQSQNPDEDPPQGAGAPAQGTAPAVFTPDTQAAYQRMITSGVDGVPGSNFNDALGGLQGAQSMEDLLGVIQQYS